jgi:glucokinase
MTGQSVATLTLGIDLGGTKVLAGVIDREDRVIGRAKVATPAREGAKAILAALVACAREALDAAGAVADQLAGVGLGSPGPLDTERGIILSSANLNVEQFAVGPELARELGRPVVVQNDVRVGGFGEFRLGAGRGHRDILVAFVGTGIGGCLIVGGQVVAGATGNAGEIGHVVLKTGGPTCGCGRRGCLEALASKTAIARRLVKAIRKGLPTVMSSTIKSKSDKLKSKELAAAYQAGDPVVVREVGRAAQYLGLGLGSLINVLGPELVIVGGGVTAALGAPYLDLVRDAVRSQALVDPDGLIPIVPAALGDDAGILGAALWARERFA